MKIFLHSFFASWYITPLLQYIHCKAPKSLFLCSFYTIISIYNLQFCFLNAVQVPLSFSPAMVSADSFLFFAPLASIKDLIENHVVCAHERARECGRVLLGRLPLSKYLTISWMISGHFPEKHASALSFLTAHLTEPERNTHVLKPLMDSSEVTSASNLMQTVQKFYSRTFYTILDPNIADCVWELLLQLLSYGAGTRY